jgi:hypothetical protein
VVGVVPFNPAQMLEPLLEVVVRALRVKVQLQTTGLLTQAAAVEVGDHRVQQAAPVWSSSKYQAPLLQPSQVV